MIRMSCPQCETALEFADDLAGLDTACYACFHPVKVPPAPVNPVRPPEPSPAIPPPRPPWSSESPADRWRPDYSSSVVEDLTSRRQRQSSSGNLLSGKLGLWIALALGLVVAVMFGLSSSGGSVWIYIDNAGQEPMVVTVDEKEEAVIAPGQFEKIECPPGERRIEVRCGTEVLFDGVKDLEKPGSWGVTRRYLFNPDNRNRYRTYTVKYGSSLFEGLMNKLDKEGSPEDRKKQIQSAYQKLAAEPQLLPPSNWMEVPRSALVLTREPESVMSRSSTEKRTVLARVDPTDYAFIEAARANQDPSEDDLEALAEVVERVLEARPD